jgi:hypothetical protein
MYKFEIEFQIYYDYLNNAATRKKVASAEVVFFQQWSVTERRVNRVKYHYCAELIHP